MKRILQTVGILILAVLAMPALRAQQGFPFITLTNDTTTGTTANHLVSVTGTGAAIITTAGATSGVIGISTNGGKLGTANVQYAGQATCTFDGATTAGDYVTISAGTNGACTDAGASCPATEAVGIIFQTHSGAGDYPILLTIGGCPGAGGAVITGTGTAGDVTAWSGPSALNNGPAKLLLMDATASATDGVIRFGGTPFLHDFTGGSVYLGEGAGNFTMTGNQNVAIGDFPFIANTTGTRNVSIGESPLAQNTTGSGNVAIGDNAMFGNTTGSTNQAVGSNALALNTTGSSNSGFGDGTLALNTTGGSNSALGTGACQTNTTGSNNTCVGRLADVASAALSGAVALGTGAIAQQTNGITIATGAGRFLHNTGTGATFLGELAGNFTQTGISNTGIGTNALTANTTGLLNTAVGNSALILNTTGADNTALGQAALSGATTSGNNTAVGVSALVGATTGAGGNVGVGVQAGQTVTTGTSNTLIGTSADVAGATQTNSTAIGSGAVASASNHMQLGNTSLTGVDTAAVVTTYGNVATAGDGLAAIRAEVPVIGGTVTVGPTNLLTAPTPDLYHISSYANTVTAGTGACTMVLSFDYTDSTGAKTRTLTALDVGSTGATEFQQFDNVIYVASGNVTYTATVAGAGCTNQVWDLHMTALQL